MTILLDESVPQKITPADRGRPYSRYHVDQGWSGLKNGALLTAAEGARFELFIKAGIAGIRTAIKGVTPGSYAEVEIPE